MKFYSKYANLQVLLEDRKIRFVNGIYEATKAEAKELEKSPGFGISIWKEQEKNKKKK